MLRDDGEDAGRESHIEDTVSLGTAGLELLEVLVEVLEGLILVILTRDVCAKLAEILELLLNLLGRGLHVRLDASEVFFMVHLRTGISDNSDIFGEKLVAVLETVVSTFPATAAHNLCV